MFCIKCGADNSDKAKFCRKCGVELSDQRSDYGAEPVEAEEETRVAVRRDAEIGNRVTESAEERTNRPIIEAVPPALTKEGSRDEAELFSISPTLLFVKAGYAAAAVGALILVGLTSAFLWHFVSVGLSVLLGLLLLLVPAYYHVRRKMVRYMLTESTLEVDSGFVSKTTRNIPLRQDTGCDRVGDAVAAAGRDRRCCDR